VADEQAGRPRRDAQRRHLTDSGFRIGKP
jgi:hypothetical protein